MTLMGRVVWTLFACLALTFADSPLEAEDSPQRWECVVFLKTVVEKEGKPHSVGGSGFLLKQESRLYLVTAGHVAEVTQGDTQVFFSVGERSRMLTLADLGFSPTNSWQSKPGFDLAILPIENSVIANATPWDVACCLAKPPPRRTELEFVGFPFAAGLEAAADLEPIVVEGRIASKELNSPFTSRADRVILCTPPIADGTSGGPAFTPTSGDRWELAGMYVGNLIDRSGAKLSKMVSAEAILALIAAQKEEGTRNGERNAAGF